MAEWTTQRGVNMPAKGQRGAMECWITCYEMMLNANGINWTKEQIVKRMANRGFGDAALCVNAGLSDPELAQCATALGVGQSSTSAVNTFEGLRNMLLMCGPLWVAGQCPGSDKKLYNHIIMVIGVDDDGDNKRVRIVNPWLQNIYDSPSKGFIWWSDFKKVIKSTLNVQGSLQFITPIQAVALTLAP
jgi:hypothetical protein